MSEPISPADVAHVARLARLELTAAEIERYTEQLGIVIEHFHDIDELDLADVVPMTQPLPLQNVFREDVGRSDARPRRGARRGTGRGGRALPRPADPGRGAVTRRPTPPASRRPWSRSWTLCARARPRPWPWSSPPRPLAAREAEVHAFNLVLADEARAAAAAIDERIARGEDPGPLAGVPIALKDNLCTRGIPTTCSSRILEGWRPPYDATVVERLAAAGAVIVGKTNLDEFAMGSSTENSAFGPTSNPHDATPRARRLLGRERRRRGGGVRGRGRSARTPAAPSASRLPSAASSASSRPTARSPATGWSRSPRASTRSARFALTVEDAAVLLEVIAGHDPLDSTRSRSRPRPSGRRCRTAWRACASAASPSCRREPIQRYGSPRRRVRVARAGRGQGGRRHRPRLRLRAHRLLPDRAGRGSSNLARYDGVRYGLRIDAADTAAMNAATRVAGFGPEVKRRIMLGTYALSAGYYDAYYGKALKVRRLIADDFAGPTRTPTSS